MSKKTFEVLGTSDHFEKYQSTIDTNWNICFVCQEDGQGQLVCPAKSKTSDGNSGYQTVYENMKRFEDIGQIPFSLKRRLENPSLMENFVQFEAKFHKSCKNQFDNYHYGRACKKSRINESESSGSKSILKTRSQYSAENFQPTCILCDQCDTDENLHQARTFALDQRIRKAASLLSDAKLLAKLSEGDLVAIEARYHKACLTSLGNRVRAFNASRSKVDSEDDIIFGVVLDEITSYIRDCSRIENSVPVFKLSDLKKICCERLQEHGASEEKHAAIHSTRLKEKILEQLPELSEHKKGREVLLTLKEETGTAIFDSCLYSGEDDGRCLARAAKIIRKHMFPEDNETQDAVVPASLYSLIKLILGVSVIGQDTHEKTNKPATSISQLIRFNAIKKVKKHAEEVQKKRHAKTDETEFPLFVGLMLHSKTRKKGLITDLAQHGVSVPYTRVQNFELALTKQLCTRYKELGVVCPPSIQNGLFSIAAIDNIDHNPSSTTATDAFHGTSISIFQYPIREENLECVKLNCEPNNCDQPLELPQYYTEICPVKTITAEYPLQTTNTEPIPEESSRNIMTDWLQHIQNWDKAEEIPLASRISWAPYLAKKLEMDGLRPRTLSTLLPLLRDSITSNATVAHTMKVIKLLLHHINPDQIAVITADQPVYAIGKQVQWLYPNVYGEDSLVMMMGSLHIEMCLLATIGDWLDGSGWVEILVKADINTPGRTESMLHGRHVKRCRYAHQVTSAALCLLLNDSHKNSNSSLSLQDWVELRRQESAQFNYWVTVMELEALLLQLVQSLRESDFIMFVRTLEEIAPWVFAMDHTNYARWLPIFIEDLKRLSVRHPSVYHEFMQGNFTVTKTNRAFSSMGVDQGHEQNNKIVKIEGGAIGILENETALMKWMIGGPEIPRLVNEFKGRNEADAEETKESITHHEDSDSFEKRFRKDLVL